MRPYYIVSPDYRHNSGGIKVLHKLCHLLNESGQEAYVSTPMMNSQWNTPYRAFDTDDIVIYPEIIKGNPLQAKRVVRYVLNKPGFLGGDTTFDQNEVIIAFDSSFYPDTHILKVQVIERDIFYPQNKKRTKISCWFGNASKTGVTYKIPDSWIQITKGYPSTREELAILFNESKYFVTYHALTALITEARLCHCPVVVFDDNHISRDQFRLLYGEDGISWGYGDIENAIQTVSKASDFYKAQENESLVQLQEFISITQYACKE